MPDLSLNLATLKRVSILEITGFSKSVNPKAERTANHSYWVIRHPAKKSKCALWCGRNTNLVEVLCCEVVT